MERTLTTKRVKNKNDVKIGCPLRLIVLFRLKIRVRSEADIDIVKVKSKSDLKIRVTSEVDVDIVEVKNRVTSENNVFFLSLEMGDFIFSHSRSEQFW